MLSIEIQNEMRFTGWLKVILYAKHLITSLVVHFYSINIDRYLLNVWISLYWVFIDQIHVKRCFHSLRILFRKFRNVFAYKISLCHEYFLDSTQKENLSWLTPTWDCSQSILRKVRFGLNLRSMTIIFDLFLFFIFVCFLFNKLFSKLFRIL